MSFKNIQKDQIENIDIPQVNGLTDSGPGTNFLADDGTYKAAGGGGISEVFYGVKRSGGLSLTTAEQTVILNSSPETDINDNGNYSNSTGIYTIPSNGTYRFDCILVAGGGIQNNDYLQVGVKKNGTDIGSTINQPGGITFAQTIGYVINNCSTSDQITFFVRNVSGNRGSGANSIFSAYKIN